MGKKCLTDIGTEGSGILCWRMLSRFGVGAYDFYWALRSARDLLTGVDPYSYPVTRLETIPNTLTTTFFGLPFVFLPPEVGGALFFGISSGLLAFGLMREGYQRLFIFLSFPYFMAMFTCQWAPLLMVPALMPSLLPLTMAKSHIGLPIFLTNWNRRGFIYCIAFGLLTLLVYPTWPNQFLSQATGVYLYHIPLIIFPGPILLAGDFCFSAPLFRSGGFMTTSSCT